MVLADLGRLTGDALVTFAVHYALGIPAAMALYAVGAAWYWLLTCGVVLYVLSYLVTKRLAFVPRPPDSVVDLVEQWREAGGWDHWWAGLERYSYHRALTLVRTVLFLVVLVAVLAPVVEWTVWRLDPAAADLFGAGNTWWVRDRLRLVLYTGAAPTALWVADRLVYQYGPRFAGHLFPEDAPRPLDGPGRD